MVGINMVLPLQALLVMLDFPVFLDQSVLLVLKVSGPISETCY